ncbi:putative monooxygenase YcnE [invertebrate metagenome]|uniref:Putative monooxygenase YcnE n=1 Tax=invertebrate metagenome TaxID=1711999 RepID=A0A2H9T7L5_9ZZZZ
MVRLLTEIQAQPGYQEQLKELLINLLEPVRQKQGCCQYELYYEMGSKGLFVIEEIWCSEKSLDQHRASQQIQEFAQKSKNLVEFIRHRSLDFIG